MDKAGIQWCKCESALKLAHRASATPKQEKKSMGLGVCKRRHQADEAKLCTPRAQAMPAE